MPSRPEGQVPHPVDEYNSLNQDLRVRTFDLFTTYIPCSDTIDAREMGKFILYTHIFRLHGLPEYVTFDRRFFGPALTQRFRHYVALINRLSSGD